MHSQSSETTRTSPWTWSGTRCHPSRNNHSRHALSRSQRCRGHFQRWSRYLRPRKKSKCPRITDSCFHLYRCSCNISTIFFDGVRLPCLIMFSTQSSMLKFVSTVLRSPQSPVEWSSRDRNRLVSHVQRFISVVNASDWPFLIESKSNHPIKSLYSIHRASIWSLLSTRVYTSVIITLFDGTKQQHFSLFCPARCCSCFYPTTACTEPPEYLIHREDDDRTESSQSDPHQWSNCKTATMQSEITQKSNSDHQTWLSSRRRPRCWTRNCGHWSSIRMIYPNRRKLMFFQRNPHRHKLNPYVISISAFQPRVH